MNNKQNCNTTACMQNLQSDCFHITVNTKALPEVRTFSVQHTLVNQYEFMSSKKENSTSSDNNRNKLSAYPPPLPKKGFSRTPSLLPVNNFGFIHSEIRINQFKINKWNSGNQHSIQNPTRGQKKKNNLKPNFLKWQMISPLHLLPLHRLVMHKY